MAEYCVPYKSTTIVYKSRLVPVTYGFVLKKETLKDNQALYKLGVKLLDEKVEPSSKQIRVNGKKVELETMTDNLSKIHEQQQLDAKSNCVKGSKTFFIICKICYNVVPTRLVQSRYNNTLTALCCQLCDNLVTTGLY